MTDAAELSTEDRKLVTLARATRARARGAEGAAVRDRDGRTYAAATVALPNLSVSALAVCISMAVASGSPGLDTAVLLTDGEITEADRAALGDMGTAHIRVNP